MNKPFLAGILFFLFILNLKAAENYPAGARSRALSNAFVSVSDTWNTFHNQAGLAELESFSAGFFYESRFMVDELSFAATSVVIPVKAGNFGLSFSQFGKGTYKEHKAGLAFSKRLTKNFNAAVQLDYLSQQYPENENAAGFITFEFGVVYAATEDLFFGAHIFNPIQGGIRTPEGLQKMPAIFRIGGHYQFPKMVLLILETEKDTQHPFVIKSGIEFSPVKNLALRFGVSGKPVNYTAGIGYQIGKITTDIGFGYHGNLGLTPSVSIQINL
ncbi:MAG TPA: hypothetical protein VLA03_02340 [Draconibacterium sp.]|nr:hypothetical protein [Draconibacterium sp.]